MSRPAKGAQADCLISAVSGVALILSISATLWFFAGFYETDPGFSPASSAFLLSIGLGAFAIIPSAVILRLSWTAWREGFQTRQGLWSLILAAPWPILGYTALQSDWLPTWLGLGALGLSIPILIWASVSLFLEHRRLMKS